VTPELTLAVVVIGGLMVGGVLLMLALGYRSVPQGHAMIVSGPGAPPKVTFSGALVMPMFHRAELLDVSVKQLRIDAAARLVHALRGDPGAYR